MADRIYLLVAVHIVSKWISRLFSSLYPSMMKWMICFATGYEKRSLATAIFVFTKLVCLGAFEVGEALLVRPT